MALGRPIPILTLSNEMRAQLEAMTRSHSLSYSLVRRAKIILMAADGQNNKAIGAKVGLSGSMVGMWRKRFLNQGFLGLYDEPKPEGPRIIGDDQITDLIHKTLKTTSPQGTPWTCRLIAAEAQLSKSTVHRVWRAFGIQPPRQKHFKLSTDPFFVEKSAGHCRPIFEPTGQSHGFVRGRKKPDSGFGSHPTYVAIGFGRCRGSHS